MNRILPKRAVFAALVFTACVLLGQRVSATDVAWSPIVGAWFVKVPGAPFEYQMYVFNADGTMHESNPDAGDANASDSSGFGAWTDTSGRVAGKFVEVTADRTTQRRSSAVARFRLKLPSPAMRLMARQPGDSTT